MNHFDTGEYIVEAHEVTRHYRVLRRTSGLRGVVRALVRPQYDQYVAVDDISFSIRRGEMVGLLGPNGAGKSTLIKLMTGVLVPTSGDLRVNGLVPHRHRLKHARDIGVVFGQRTQLWWDLPTRDSFDILRDIHRLPAKLFEEQLAEFDELLELSSFWHTPARQLSLGQRVRADLAAALLHAPSIVFLDEPTIGMDVVVKEQVRRFLYHIVHERHRTVVLTTHDMGDVERLCKRLLLVNHGRLLFDDTIEALEQRTGSTRELCARFANPSPAPELPGCTLIEHTGNEVRYRLNSAADPQEVLRRLTFDAPVVDCAFQKRALEELMRDVYRGTAELTNSPPVQQIS